MGKDNFTVVKKILAEGIWDILKMRRRWPLIEGSKLIMKFFNRGKGPGFCPVLDSDDSIVEGSLRDAACVLCIHG